MTPTKPMLDDHAADEAANLLLWQGISADPFYAKQLDAIFKGDMCDIDPSLLCIAGAYYHLSLIIPRDRVIYDMGCAYGTQAWFFRHHRRYIGVDVLAKNFLRTPNSEYHEQSIEDYLSAASIDPCHFAICNWVPPWGNTEPLVRERFEHCFVFYPKSHDRYKGFGL